MGQGGSRCQVWFLTSAFSFPGRCGEGEEDPGREPRQRERVEWVLVGTPGILGCGLSRI